MPGRYGLQLLLFSLLVDLAGLLNVGDIRQVNTILWQINTLVLCLGLASVIVAILLRIWRFLKEAD